MVSQRQIERVDGEPPFADLDRYVTYDDGDYTVICDKENTGEWLKSTITQTLEP